MSFFVHPKHPSITGAHWHHMNPGYDSTLVNPVFYFVQNRSDAVAQIDDISAVNRMGCSGRFFFILMAYPTAEDDTELVAGETFFPIGTYAIMMQAFLHRKFLYFITPVGGDAVYGQQILRLNETIVDPNRKPANKSLFRIYRSTTDSTKYIFRCLRHVGEGCLTAAGGVDTGFYNYSTFNDAVLDSQIIGFGFDSDLGHGPVIPTVTPTATFAYFITGTYGDTPATGMDFNFKQLKWSGTGITSETGFNASSDVKTWVFEKVKSKLNTPADSIYTYKIRSLGSTTNPAGYITCTASGITGDEFELLPHTGEFGAFTIRSVAHGNGLVKRFLRDSPLGPGFAASTTPSSSALAYTLRPAATPFTPATTVAAADLMEQ